MKLHMSLVIASLPLEQEEPETPDLRKEQAQDFLGGGMVAAQNLQATAIIFLLGLTICSLLHFGQTRFNFMILLIAE